MRYSQSLPVGIVAVLFMFFMVIVFLFPTTPQTDAPDMNYTVVVMGGVLFLSIVWYYLPVYGGVHWFTGPISNIGIGDSVGENKLERISGDSSSGSAAEKDVVKSDKLAADAESYS